MAAIISTTIMRKYIDQILDGTKKSEFKDASDFWVTRIQNVECRAIYEDVQIVFLCGRKSYRFAVRFIQLHKDFPREIMGKMCQEWYEIGIGARVMP